jgi:hypothetical protein
MENQGRPRVRTILRTRFVATVACVTLALAPPIARAESKRGAPSAEAVASARSHFAHGVKLYEEDDFRAALIEFNRAYELAPNWAVLYNVGQSYYQLRDYANALRTLERYVQEAGAQIASDRGAQVARELEELRGRVAHVTLNASVEGADISLDDAPLGTSPLAAPVLVGAGRHKITASKAGYAPAIRVVDIAGGDKIAVGLDLVAEAPPPAAAPVESPSYAGAGVVLALGIAGVAVGTVFGVAAIENKSTLNKDCNTQKACPSSEQGDIDAFSRNGAISTVGFGVGAAGLVLGAYLFFHERSKERASTASGPRRPEMRPGVTPWLGLGGAGVSGTF